MILAASLLAPPTPAVVSGRLDAQPAAAAATPTVSPMTQTGPRNIIKRLQDTYVSSTSGADHSQGHILRVGTPDNGATKYRGFLSFDVSKLRGAPIKRASLRLYNSYVSDCAAKAWMGVYPVTSAWNQSTLTWANQPAVGAGKATWFGLGHADCPDVPNRTNPAASNGIQRVDVTDWVHGWANGTLANHGIRLSAVEDKSTGYKEFCSMNPVGGDYACHAAYNAPTLEVEFNEGSTPVITGNDHGPAYPNNYPTAHPALEFYDSTKPSVWPSSGPYQRWIPDAYHSVFDTTLKGDSWEGGTSHKLRPGGPYGTETVLVTGDGASGFLGVIPYPSLAGYHWAINVGNTTKDLHGVEMLPDGTVVAAFADRVFGGEGIHGGLAVYSKAQGRPGAWSSTPVQETSLLGAHEVVFDPSTNSLWAIGTELLVRYDYVDGHLRWGTSYPLPKQAGSKPAYGHDLSPVYGNTDRFWIGGNGGITQFSKSGAALCHTGTNPGRWPESGLVTEKNRWCTDYAKERLVNNRGLVKSIGNDPSSGAVLSTCAQDTAGCPEAQTTYPVWTTAYLRFVDPGAPDTSAETISVASTTSDRHYKATWAVPAYQ
ncbi:DNRLRE domain-containing protein [Streptomyces sp. NPDC093600]|uniref:DNRLRE domain-containing protein n=1 Tax=Streptomyces sp. NPDC093600 TaxID=3366047 RepID=UPI003825E7A2